MSEPSWQDFYDVGKAILQTRRPSLVVEEGDVSDAILAGAASMASAIVAYASARFRACFLDGAEGQELTDLAHDRGVDRDAGDPSVGRVTLTRVSAAAGAGTIDAGTRVATEADSTGEFASFTLDEDAVFGALTTTLSNVAATCTLNGKIGNVEDGTVIRFIDPIFDPSILPANSDRFVGGLEEESDEDLRDRVRGFFLTQARGTIEALIFGAKETPGVARVSVSVDLAGIVTVYVADENGNSNAELVAAAQENLENWRDAADIVNASGGVIYSQAVSISLSVRTGISVAALIDAIRQAIISRLKRLNPGETLHPDMISAAVRDIDRDGIVTVTVITPAVAIVPGTNELIRTSNGLIDVTG